MAEQNQEGKQAQDSAEPTFNLQRTYVKDISLEMPNSPEIFLEQESPAVEVVINVGGHKLADTIYESIVTVTLTTRIQDKVLYLIEATQAGIFEAANIPAEQLDPLLGIVCPTMLYPYLRANIADLITRTTLPPLHLTEMNFQALYEERLQQLAQEQKQNNKAKPDSGIVLPPGVSRQ